MALPRPEMELIAARYAEEYRVAQRDMYRDLFFTALRVLCCIAASLYLLGMSVHVRDYQTGMLYFSSGFVFWVISVSVNLLNAYKRGIHRGDW